MARTNYEALTKAIIEDAFAKVESGDGITVRLDEQERFLAAVIALTPILAKGLDEQGDRIDELIREIAALRMQVKTLRKKMK